MLNYGLRKECAYLCASEHVLYREMNVLRFDVARFFAMEQYLADDEALSACRLRCNSPAFSAGKYMLMRIDYIQAELERLAQAREALYLRQLKTLRGRVYMWLLGHGLCRPRQPLLEMKKDWTLDGGKVLDCHVPGVLED